MAGMVEPIDFERMGRELSAAFRKLADAAEDSLAAARAAFIAHAATMRVTVRERDLADPRRIRRLVARINDRRRPAYRRRLRR